MLVFTNPAMSGHRPAYVEAFPIELNAHRNAQRGMFGAARSYGLSTNEASKGAMIRGINALLGLNIQSRRQLTVDEMRAVTVAIESGAFSKGWELSGRFTVSVRLSVDIHIEPIVDDKHEDEMRRFDSLLEDCCF